MKQEKKYLKTIEEVSDALAAGKVVYDGRGMECIKDNNGFIVGKRNGEDYILNTAFSTEYNPYILEPKPLEVKLWHLYENGRGEKVFIGYEDEDQYGEIEFVGLNKFIGMQIYRITGQTAYKGASDFDLVKEIADLSGYFK